MNKDLQRQMAEALSTAQTAVRQILEGGKAGPLAGQADVMPLRQTAKG
jgi:hypothetical protein